MTRSRKRKLQRLHGRPSAARMLAASVPTLLAGMSAYAQTTVRWPRGDRRHRAEAHGRPAVRADQHPGLRHASGSTELKVKRVRGLREIHAERVVPDARPGLQPAVYMRGVASGGNNNHSGPQPSVGIYLDEQPITTIQGALDMHMYDIARVEALAGPQGTLYGASSQAGTIRIITNKPDPSRLRRRLRARGELGRSRRHRATLRKASSTCRSRPQQPCAWSAGTATMPATSTTWRRTVYPSTGLASAIARPLRAACQTPAPRTTTTTSTPTAPAPRCGSS